jgi:predicted MFS family arabinose efflux permease
LLSLASVPGAALAIIVITLAEICFSPAHQATIAELSKPGARGSMFGLLGFAQLVGIAFAPLVGGILLDVFGTNAVGLWITLAGVLGLGQVLCMWRFAKMSAP